MQVALLDIRKDQHPPAPLFAIRVSWPHAANRVAVGILRRRFYTVIERPIGERAELVVIAMHRERQVVQIALALHLAGGLASRLDGGKKQSNQGANDRNDNQQLN